MQRKGRGREAVSKMPKGTMTPIVIPVKTGIYWASGRRRYAVWVPACAGTMPIVDRNFFRVPLRTFACFALSVFLRPIRWM